MKLLIVTQKVDKNDQLLGFFIEWLRRFSGKFEKLTVLCLEKGEFDLPENVKVISLGKDRGAGKLEQLFNFYFSIFSLRSEYDAAFVHMNPIWVIAGGPAWRLMSKKTFFWYTSGGVTTKLKFAEKFAQVIFTASKESFRLSSNKVIVTGHGIDTGLFQPSEKLKVNPSAETKKGSGPFLIEKRVLTPFINILSVGRIAPVKNYETLLDAAKILKDKGVEFLVTMVGGAALDSDTRYLASLKFKVESLKLENNFNFLGKVNHEDLVPYYQSHDVFIHLSKTGSVDKTLLEAMACGMKVLSSNDSAKAFLPSELLFKEDDFSGLANKIISLKDSESPLKLREYVINNHNLDNLINKISQIIHE